MADEKLKIQPADTADTAAGTTPDTGATDELPDYTAEQFAGLPDEQKLALMGNVKKFRAEATQKSQEAAEIKRQNEQLKAEREYFKSEADKRQELVDKYSEFFTRQQQPDKSTSSQPPKYDAYKPDESYEALQKYYDSKLDEGSSQYSELKKEFESLKEETNVGLTTIKMERYLEKARPALKCNDVSDEEVVLWHNMHPEIKEPSADSIAQALRERQSIYDSKVQAKYEDYLKEKEEAAKGAQEVPGAAYAGGAPDMKKWLAMSEAERETEMKKFFSKGGGTR